MGQPTWEPWILPSLHECQEHHLPKEGVEWGVLGRGGREWGQVEGYPEVRWSGGEGAENGMTEAWV